MAWLESVVGGSMRTSNNGRNCIWNHRPQLDLIGIFGKPKVLNNGWQLGKMSQSLGPALESMNVTYKKTKRIKTGQNGEVCSG